MATNIQLREKKQSMQHDFAELIFEVVLNIQTVIISQLELQFKSFYEKKFIALPYTYTF